MTYIQFSANVFFMLKIRLQRVGRKHEPVFRVVVTDSHSGPKAGKSVEILGLYDPRFNKSDIKGERVKYWMNNGAQVSPTVHNLLVGSKVIEGKKVNVLPKKSAPVKEEAPAEEVVAEAPQAEAPAPAATETPAPEAPAETAPEAPKEEAPAEVPAVEAEPATEAPAEEKPAE